MNNWKNAVITDKGLALQSKLIAGTSLEITRAVAGSGVVEVVELARQTTITDQKQELLFKPISYPETGKCKVPVFLTNDDVSTGYTCNVIGFFANDPDEGEILYFICQADQTDTGTTGVVVPSATEMPGFSSEWVFYFRYGQASNVIISVDPTAYLTVETADERYVTHQEAADQHAAIRVYVDTSIREAKTEIDVKIISVQESISEHISDKNNPHNVTVEQIGAVSAADFESHLNDQNAHHEILSGVQASIQNHETRISRLEDAMYNDITGNPHSYAFDSIAGITIVSGCWNQTAARLEC